MAANRHIFVLALGLLIIGNDTFAQRTVAVKTKTITSASVKPKEKLFIPLSIKAGANLSVIFLARNVKENNNEPGYCFGGGYEVNNFFRVAALYSYFKPINIAPTWENIKANSIEINAEIVARFPNKKTLLYPFAGLSYNTFKGFFTGQQDFLNLKEFYTPNSRVTNNWLGLNLGTGLEHNFGIIGLFIDYRMRVGKQDKVFNIMDVCYTGGVKIRFPYGEAGKRFFGGKDRYNLKLGQNPRFMD